MREDGQTNGRGYSVPVGVGMPGATPHREGSEGEYVLSLGDLLDVVRRRVWVIALTALVLAALAMGYGLLLQTPQYEASVRLLIGQRQDGDGGSSLGGDVQGLQDLTVTMTETVQTRPVAEAVIGRLELPVTPDQFLENLHVEQEPGTTIIAASYEDPNPGRAQRVANAVGEEFSAQVSELSDDVYAVTATVVDPAVTPQEPVSPEPLRDGLLALALGAILGVGLAFLLERLDDSWRSPEQVEQVSGVPTFGVIPEFKLPKVKDKKAQV